MWTHSHSLGAALHAADTLIESPCMLVVLAQGLMVLEPEGSSTVSYMCSCSHSDSRKGGNRFDRNRKMTETVVEHTAGRSCS